MPNTLRRKMFKLGGSANTHGVGITSGLKMKKGGMIPGKVGEPIFTKKGPDGKEREMQNPLALLNYLGLGIRTLPTIGKGIQSLVQRKGIQPITNFIKTGRLDGRAAKVGEIASRPSPAQIARMKPEEIDRIFGSRLFGFGPRFGQFSRAAQIGRGAEIATPLLAPVGIASALSPRMERGKDKPIGTFVENIREVPELALDLMTGAPAGTIGLLAGQGLDLFRPSAAIQEARGLMPKDKDEIETTGAIETDKQEKQMDKLKSDAEEKIAIYQSLMGTPDNTATYAKALLNFGATALAGTGDTATDLSRAVQAGTEPLVTEAAARKATDQSIRSLAIQEVIAKDADDRKLLIQAAASGPKELNKMTRALEARDAGVTVAAEIDNKGKLTNATPGVVLADLDGTFGGKFVAVNKKTEAKPFNNIEDALAFAATGG